MAVAGIGSDVDRGSEEEEVVGRSASTVSAKTCVSWFSAMSFWAALDDKLVPGGIFNGRWRMDFFPWSRLKKFLVEGFLALGMI